VELADKLAARGYSVAALNGDIPQPQREKTVEKLKRGQLDIVVATDVAARGLDVARISHVINFDIPYDVEAYVHRIGRTGRAGRTGDAILFAANRERRLLRAIEKATGNTIEKMTLPTADEVSDKRNQRFKARITETLDTRDVSGFRQLVEEYQHEHGVPVIDIAAALVALAQGKQKAATAEVHTEKPGKPERKKRQERSGAKPERPAKAKRPADTHGKDKPKASAHKGDKDAPRTAAPKGDRESIRPAARKGDKESTRPGIGAGKAADIGMERFRIEVGHDHGVKPGNIVGAIANEAEIDSEYIGRIDIQDDHSFIDLPEGMPKELFKHLRKVWVSGQQLQISKLDKSGSGKGARKGKPKRKRPAP
jgi:ATP-dependent RNA helicase DeaD